MPPENGIMMENSFISKFLDRNQDKYFKLRKTTGENGQLFLVSFLLLFFTHL